MDYKSNIQEGDNFIKLTNKSSNITLENDDITLTVLNGVIKMTGLPSSPIGLDVGSLYTTTGGILKIVE